MRICFFGDSFVNGTGDDDGLGWVGRIVAKARQRGRDVTGYNLGIRRDRSVDVAARWKYEAKLRLPPGCDGRLVFSFGSNDCLSITNDGRRPLERGESLVNAQAILDAAHHWLPTLMVGPAIVADDAIANSRICDLSADYAALCARIGVPYLEICNHLLDSPAWKQEALAGDGAHPNRNGYMILADVVSNWTAWRCWMEGPTTTHVTASDLRVRPAHAGDEAFLLTMLFYAAHASDEPGATPAHLLANPALARYVTGFGRPSDLGVVAIRGETPVGAAWVRLLTGGERGYGWVDDETPELAVAVLPDAVNAGVGTAMLTSLLARAKDHYPAISLSVRADNPARRLYIRLGFEPVATVTNRVGGISYTMRLRFYA